MNSTFLFEKLETSQEFNEFKQKYPDCYFCSGFIVLDYEGKTPENKYHLDFYIPSNKKTFSFELENGVKLVELERSDENFSKELSLKQEFDFELIKDKILDKMAENKINNKIQKMIFSLQKKDNEDMLLGTIFLSGLALLRLNFHIKDQKISDFEKKSFFDMMKIVKK